MEMWFDGGLPQDVEARVDLLAEMGLALGPAVAGPAPLDTSEFAHETMEKLLSGQGRALAVQVGLAGDAATMSPLGWLTSGGPTRERLVASESVYRGALASRRIFAAVRCRTVSSSDPLMTYALALDNRVLLPPFPPLGRDQDGVFGWVLRATEPLSFTGHLPFAIAHEPAEARFFPADAVARSFNGLLLNEAIRLALGEPASGAQLEETAALPPADFARVLTERRVASLSRAIVYLESVLTAARARPAYWARDMQLAIRQAERQMTSPDPLRFEEPGSACAQEDVRAACRRYIRLYAGLLRSWPEIRAVLRKD
jgi:hypothetical protein